MTDKYKMTGDQTVEGRLDGIMAKDSPLMKRASTQGMQYGNSRGLLNSSMAAGAAQGAMIDRATPIAQQDASQAFQRGNIRLDHDFTTGRDKTLHGYNREQDDWRQGHTLDRDRIQHGYSREQDDWRQGHTQDNMRLGHGFNREQDSWRQGYTQDNMRLDQGFTQDNMRLGHGFNREQDSWRHGQTMDRDATQQGYNQDNMRLGHGQTMERDSTQQGYHQSNMNLGHNQTMQRDSTQQGYNQDNMRLGHTQDMSRDQAGYNQQRTMTELGHVLGMENMEFAKNLDQRHQVQLLEIGQDFQRLGQYESGLTNTWNGMLNMMTQSGATTPEQYQHLMNQMMPIMNNTRDFYSSLYGNMGAK